MMVLVVIDKVALLLSPVGSMILAEGLEAIICRGKEG